MSCRRDDAPAPMPSLESPCHLPIRPSATLFHATPPPWAPAPAVNTSVLRRRSQPFPFTSSYPALDRPIHASPAPNPSKAQTTPPTTLALDASSFPHLIDAIFASAPHAALLALRRASRDFRHRAEKQYARNLTLTRHGLTRPRGRLPALSPSTRCDELLAPSDPDYFSPRYSHLPLPRVHRLILNLGYEAQTLNHARLVLGRGGLETNPSGVTLIVTPPAWGCWLVRSGNEYAALVGRVGEWVASGARATLVDAQLARCLRYPCEGCGHLGAVRRDFEEAVGRLGAGGEMEFISMAQYVERVGGETAARHSAVCL